MKAKRKMRMRMRMRMGKRRRWRWDSGCWDLRLSAISTCATIKLSRCPRLTDWLVRPNLSQISPMFGYGDLMIASLEQWKENKGRMIRKGKAGKRKERRKKRMPHNTNNRKKQDEPLKGGQISWFLEAREEWAGMRAAWAGIGQMEAFVYKPWNKKREKKRKHD